jgi:hypothetical protein
LIIYSGREMVSTAIGPVESRHKNCHVMAKLIPRDPGLSDWILIAKI